MTIDTLKELEDLDKAFKAWGQWPIIPETVPQEELDRKFGPVPEKKCECGADSIESSGHSEWCPKNVKENL